MKKILTSSLIIPSIFFAPIAHADGFSPEEEQTFEQFEQQDSSEVAEEAGPRAEELATQPQDLPDDSEQEGTSVGQAASDGTNAAKSRQWRNIAIATGAVALAVTALILVASNDGHHHHKSDK
jgi:hypothetical protein